MDEENDCELRTEELERAYATAIVAGTDVRALVLINPGHPTGQVLTESNVQDVVQFCVNKGIVLLADEVFQENMYVEAELVSFHSTSKGVFGECGRRGGYME